VVCSFCSLCPRGAMAVIPHLCRVVNCVSSFYRGGTTPAPHADSIVQTFPNYSSVFLFARQFVSNSCVILSHFRDAYRLTFPPFGKFSTRQVRWECFFFSVFLGCMSRGVGVKRGFDLHFKRSESLFLISYISCVVVVVVCFFFFFFESQSIDGRLSRVNFSPAVGNDLCH